MNEEQNIIAYVLTTPDGTELISKTVHDCIFYTDKNGKEYMTDGGRDYHHYIKHGDEQTKCITDESSFKDIQKYMFWGTYGKDGKQPLQYKALKDLDTDHIEAIIRTQKQLPQWRIKLFNKELKERFNKTISNE